MPILADPEGGSTPLLHQEKEALQRRTISLSYAGNCPKDGEHLPIRVLMNHKSLSTTARYLHTQDAQLSVAVNGIVLKID